MKQLVQQMIRISRNKKQQARTKKMKELGLQHLDETQKTKKEQQEEIYRIRKRVEDIERRKRDEISKNQRHNSHNKLKGYGKSCMSKRIPYPFMTIQNDELYALFMTKILSNLEVRYFDQGQTICNELDECLEILFVIDGKYDVGYEVNKICRLRR